MGKVILSIGEPGTGKSRAIKNLDPNSTFIIRPNHKDLPFKGSRSLYNSEKKNIATVNSFQAVGTLLEKINGGKKYKVAIIEDITHFFSSRVMRDAKIQGFDKWRDLAVDAYNNIIGIEEKLREDLYVIIIGHVETTTDVEGVVTTKLLTPGKLLDSQVKIPSYVSYILHTDVSENDDGVHYKFLTNRNGSGKEAKSPEGCLELLEENDYKAIIEKIEAYHN